MTNDSLNMVLKIFNDRIAYHTIQVPNPTAATAYQSAKDIILAASNDNVEVLRQFDYYDDGEDNLDYDYLFEVIDGDCEGEQFLVEEKDLYSALAVAKMFFHDVGNFRFLERLSVAEGEMTGLDTY